MHSLCTIDNALSPKPVGSTSCCIHGLALGLELTALGLRLGLAALGLTLALVGLGLSLATGLRLLLLRALASLTLALALTLWLGLVFNGTAKAGTHSLQHPRQSSYAQRPYIIRTWHAKQMC